MPFDSAIRNKLQKVVTVCRRILTDEFTSQLQSIYGIQPTGEIANLAFMSHLDDEHHTTASLLLERVNHLADGHSTDKKAAAEAIDRVIREQAFTVLNRLAALRMCEERGIVQECIRKGFQSRGFQVYCTVVGASLGSTYERYRIFLQCLFDEISLDLGVLFDRFSPLSLLFPREPVLLEVLEVLDDEELKGIWAEDETIGWVYQYFNLKQERDAMRKASRSPRNTRELAVRNQFFTPRYVVEFLTDNTLGRIWYDMRKGETALNKECRYLVRRPNEVFLTPGEKAPTEPWKETDLSQEESLKKTVHIEHRSKKDPRNLCVLDPACGSGHFLLYAFDLLERIYEEAWVDTEIPKSEITGCTLREDFETLDDLRRAVPKLIVEHNLYGIDIDPRAVQITALALWLRAQKRWKQLGLKPTERPRVTRSHIVTAEPMPGVREFLDEFASSFKGEYRIVGELVRKIWGNMQLAGEAGSLLEIEEELREAIDTAKSEWERIRSGGEKLAQTHMWKRSERPPRQTDIRKALQRITRKEFWDEVEDHVLAALEYFAESASNGKSYQRRLFAEDAAEGFAFIDLCRKRYDVILMNPPFGAPSRDSKEYIEGRYPKTKGDILANFIERALHFMDNQGRIGAISSRTPFFLGSFDTFRTEFLGKLCHVRLLADLGEGVLEAMVETAIYVLTRDRCGEPESLFLRLLIDTEKGKLLQQLTEGCLDACLSNRIFVINPKHFAVLSGSPYAYWVSRSTIETVGAHPCIEGNKGAIRVGLQTGEDFRHLRLLWEIPNRNLVPRLPKRYNPGQTIREQCIHQLKSIGSWVPFSKTDMASPWFSPITLAVNWAKDGKELKNFTDSKGKVRSRPQNEDFYFKPGFSYMGRSTRLVPYLVPAGVMPTARRSQIFPVKGEEYAVLAICASNIGSAVARFRGEKFAWPNFQAGMVQGLPACDFPAETLALIKEHIDAEVNKRRAVVQGYEPFQEFLLPAWILQAEGGETGWDLYSLFGRSLENKIADAFGLRSKQLAELERDIKEAVSIRGRSKDAESEDASEETSEDDEELNIELISETPEEKAVGLFAYAVGVALGRWDVRIAMDPPLAPKLSDSFAPLPVCPPGMLVGPDGLPAEANRIVSEEWLRARPDSNTLPPEGSIKNPSVPDDGYPLRVSWDGILLDDSGFNGTQPHRDDIVRRVSEVLDLLWGDRSYAIEQDVCEILGASNLREYFRKPSGFFDDHLKRYSKSRRKAPIYWPLSTESGSYTLWVYYHRLTDQTLYQCVNDYIKPKLEAVNQDADKLMQQVIQGNETKQRDALEKLQKFQQELTDFRDELLRVAQLPYQPDLNDGVLITASPLHKLFRLPKWRKDLEECWKKLEAGEYDWAHLAYSIWPKRVRDKCRSDRSLAIAHRLEELYQELETHKKPRTPKGKV